MGEVEGKKNAWGYAEGGMGGVSQAIARAAESYGASLHTDCVSIIISLPLLGLLVLNAARVVCFRECHRSW